MVSLLRTFSVPALAVAAALATAPGALAATPTTPATWTPAVAYPAVTLETPTAVGIDAHGTQTALLGGSFEGTHGVYAITLARGASAWSSPQLLAEVTGKVSGLALSVGAGGAAVAVWHDGSRPSTTFVAARSASGSWSSSQTAAEFLGRPAASTVGLATFAVAPSGELWAAWYDGASAAVRAARRAPGSASWTDDTPISTVTPVVPRFDAAGDAFAVYEEQDRLLATQRAAGSTEWDPAHQLNRNVSLTLEGGDSNYLGAWDWEWSVNADGDVAVAWVDTYGPPRNQLRVAQRQSGGAWSTPTTLADAPANAEGAFPGLAIAQDREGRATVVAQHNLPDVAEAEPTGAELLSSSQDATGHWPALQTVELPESARPRPTIQDVVELAEGGAGHAVASWLTADGVAVAVRAPSGGFSFSAPSAMARAATPLAVSDTGLAVLGSGSTVQIGDAPAPRLLVPVSMSLQTIMRAACPNTVAVYVNGKKVGGLTPEVAFAKRCLYRGSVPAPAGLRAGQTVLLTVTGINVFTGWGLGRVAAG